MGVTSWILVLLEGKHSLQLKPPKTTKPHTLGGFRPQHHLEKDWSTFLDNGVTFYLNSLKWLIQPSARNLCYLLGFPWGTRTEFRQFLWQLSERPNTSLATQVKGFLGGGEGILKSHHHLLLTVDHWQIHSQGCWPCCFGLMPWFTTAHKIHISPHPASGSSLNNSTEAANTYWKRLAWHLLRLLYVLPYWFLMKTLRTRDYGNICLLESKNQKVRIKEVEKFASDHTAWLVLHLCSYS